MKKLTTDDLLKLEDYARERPEFRKRVMAHKRGRCVPLGPHMTLFFEDRWTIQYQVQEMLRAEKIFEPADIEEELAAYNPLIPDGRNWKVTCMIEYDDPEVRRRELKRLRGIEDQIWVQVDNGTRVHAIADEDLDRSDMEKTSAVHFLRFELSEADVRAVKAGQPIRVGCDHAEYRHETEIDDARRQALAADLSDDAPVTA